MKKEYKLYCFCCILLIFTNVLKYNDTKIEFLKSYNYQNYKQQQNRQLISVEVFGTKNPDRIIACEAVKFEGNLNQDQKNKGITQIKEYQKAYGGSIVKEYMESRSIPSVNQLIRRSVLLAISLLCFIFILVCLPYYCCYFCCDQSCPPFSCCKRDVLQQPYTKKEMLCPIIVLLFFAIFSVTASIAGLSYGGSVYKSFKEIKCTVLSTLDDLNLKNIVTKDDSSTAVFIGLQQIEQKVKFISNKILDFKNNMSNLANTNALDQINNLQTQIGNFLDNIYVGAAINQSYNAYYTVPYLVNNRPSPSLYFSDVAYKDGAVQILKTTNSESFDILLKVMSIVKEKAQQIFNDQTLTNSIQQGQNSIGSFSKTLNNQIKFINDNLSIADNIFDMINKALTSLYSLFIVFSLASVILSALGFIKKIWKLRLILNFLWIALALITALAFLVVTLLNLVSILTMESCIYVEGILQSQAEFQKLNFDQSIKDKITICLASLGGDGNILQSFGIQKQIKDLDQINDNFNESLKQYDTDNKKLNDAQILFDEFAKQHQDLKDKGYFDMAQANNIKTNDHRLDEEHAQQNMQTLLTRTKNQEFCGAAQVETIVTTTTDCATDKVQVKTAASFAIYAANQCIILEDLLNDQPSDAQYNTRYNGCATQPTDYFKAVFSQMTDTKNVQIRNINRVRSQTAVQIRNLYTNFVQTINQFEDEIQNIKNNFKSLIAEISGVTGIADNVNCLFFGQNIQKLFEGVCYSMTPNLYTNWKIMYVVCFSNYFLWFFIFKVSFRFIGRMKEEEKTNMVNQIHPDQELVKIN